MADRLLIDAPGFTAREIRITRLGPHEVTLPPMRLSPACYVHVRFVSVHGESIPSARVMGRSYDVRGMPITQGLTLPPQSVEQDGSLRIGPLPRSVTLLEFDTPPFARVRLPDVVVTGELPVLDLGTIRVGAGARVRVRVVDRAGRPQPGERVWLEEAALPAPLVAWRSVAVAGTDGEVTFERLAKGTYRLLAGDRQSCDDPMPPVERHIAVPSNGTVEQRIVLGGSRLRIRLTAGSVALANVGIRVLRDNPPLERPSWMRDQASQRPRLSRGAWSCPPTMTDADGYARLPYLPPGDVQLRVDLSHSEWVRTIRVPSGDADLSVRIPDGSLPLRIVDAATDEPVQGTATWRSPEAYVESHPSFSGAILLDGVGSSPGRLTVLARGYVPYSRPLLDLSGTVQEVRLHRAYAPTLHVHVVTPDGRPIAGSAVLLTPADPLDEIRLTTADPEGRVRIAQLRSGRFEVQATAAGFAPGESTPVELPRREVEPVILVLAHQVAP